MIRGGADRRGAKVYFGLLTSRSWVQAAPGTGFGRLVFLRCFSSLFHHFFLYQLGNGQSAATLCFGSETAATLKPHSFSCGSGLDSVLVSVCSAVLVMIVEILRRVSGGSKVCKSFGGIAQTWTRVV